MDTPVAFNIAIEHIIPNEYPRTSGFYFMSYNALKVSSITPFY
jgi:hypothetical protein